MKAIDLFAGCGGMSAGFIENGFDIKLAVEINGEIAQSYKNNHIGTEVIVDDINNIDDKVLRNFRDTDVIIGGPPCQGFSMAGSRIREGFIDDPRNYLFKGYFNVVQKIKPKYFVMENVPGLLTMQNGAVFNEIKRIFSDDVLLDGDKYYVHHNIFKAEEMGIPQKRERLVIIGALNKEYNFEETYDLAKKGILNRNDRFFDKVNVRDAIGDIPEPTKSGKVILNDISSDYQSSLRTKDGVTTNHLKTNHSKKAVERMSKIKPGENYKVLDEVIKSVHSGSYGRMERDKPSVTITTRFDTPAGGRYIHPEDNRTITPREAARIQSFPDKFDFTGSKTSICTQIGNAVPPKLAYFLSEFIKTIDEN
ncbi:DNA cytosine methyltransferase [Anaerococcus sp.]|uniref:DNA cytosine methyltransferase n=1 Tax=Anaerococcus sp. TaxID=1872515 RepID=UPI00280AE80D|nr:DNA cytosine methyltransferase [Anaerococcus sp.]MDU3176669.1 DNA cytosine methyltransferase [Anaerococcus sp.]